MGAAINADRTLMNRIRSKMGTVKQPGCERMRDSFSSKYPW